MMLINKIFKKEFNNYRGMKKPKFVNKTTNNTRRPGFPTTSMVDLRSLWDHDLYGWLCI